MSILIITNILYALGYPLSKIALSGTQPLFLVSIKLLLGGTLIIAFKLAKAKLYQKRVNLYLDKEMIWPILLTGFFGMYLSNIFSFLGLSSTISSTRAAFIDNLAPIMAAFLEWLIFNNRYSMIEWIGILIATMGTMPVLGNSNNIAYGDLLNYGITGADLLLFLSELCWVYGFILVRKISLKKEYDPIISNGISMLLGGVFALIHSLLTESWTPIPAHNIISTAFHVILLVIIYNIIIDWLYAYLAGRYTATIVTLSGFTIPLFTAFFDWTFFGLKVQPIFWVSAILISVGLLISLKYAKLDVKT